MVVLLVLIAAGLFVLLPHEVEQLARHVVAGVLFSSNLLLWKEVGYFDADAALKPLLHLWSVGVEEQFYLVWPVTLLALARMRKQALVIVACIALASFALGVFMLGDYASAAYYAPFTRIWELLVGALLAISRVEWRRNTASLAGCALLVVSLAMFNADSPFPGWRALLPTFGTALIIAAGPTAFVNRLFLGNAFATYIGRISYPLYLWHWPLLSFVTLYVLPDDIRMVHAMKLAALGFAFVAAALTYHFVELPLRRARLRPTALRLAAASAGIVALAIGIIASSGIPSRWPDDGLRVVESKFEWPDRINKTCRSRFPEFEADWVFCLQSDTADPSVILLGDSHANHLYPGLVAHAALQHHSVLQVGRYNLGVRAPEAGGRRGNSKARQERFLLGVIRETPSLRFAVLSTMWPTFDSLAAPDLARYLEVLSSQLALLEARNIKTVIVFDTPRLDWDPHLCFSRPFRRAVKECSTPVDYQLRKQAAMGNALRAMLRDKHPGALVFSPIPGFCPSPTCDLAPKGEPLLRDFHHLSLAGSELFASAFVAWARDSYPAIIAK